MIEVGGEGGGGGGGEEITTIIVRGIGFCTMIHFLSWFVQIDSLFGPRGVFPAQKYLDEKSLLFRYDLFIWPAPLQAEMDRWGRYPTIFWVLGCSSFSLKSVCAFGAFCSFFLVLYPDAYLLWPICYICTISLAVITEEFGLQTETLMCEVTFICSLVAPYHYFTLSSSSSSSSSSIMEPNFHWTETPIMEWPMNPAVLRQIIPPVLVFQWLIFRMMIAAGLVKWYGSEKWRNLTAMNDHYFTQPLPTPLSYYIHSYTPQFIHKLSVLGTLIVEIVFPWFQWAPFTSVRVFVCSSYIFLMVGINVAGNYGHLGFITSILSLSVLDNTMFPSSLISPLPSLSSFIPFSLPPLPLTCLGPIPEDHFFLEIFVIIFAYLCVFQMLCGIPPLMASCGLHSVFPRFLLKAYSDFIQSFRIANPFGVFGAMQDYRWELVLEGSRDGKTWRRYANRHKPWSPSQALKFVIPGYWPRFDWILWLVGVRGKNQFDVLMPVGDSRWIQPPSWYPHFLRQVMDGNPLILDLLGSNPFKKEGGPLYLRSAFCDYQFAPPGSKDWWVEREIVVPQAFCLGPKGWAPPVLELPKQPQQAARRYKATVGTG